MKEEDLVVLMHNAFSSPSIFTLSEARKKSKIEIDVKKGTCVLTGPGEYKDSKDIPHKLRIGKMWHPNLDRGYGGPIPVAVYDRTNVEHLREIMWSERALSRTRYGHGMQMGDL